MFSTLQLWMIFGYHKVVFRCRHNCQHGFDYSDLSYCSNLSVEWPSEIKVFLKAVFKMPLQWCCHASWETRKARLNSSVYTVSLCFPTWQLDFKTLRLLMKELTVSGKKRQPVTASFRHNGTCWEIEDGAFEDLEHLILNVKLWLVCFGTHKFWVCVTTLCSLTLCLLPYFLLVLLANPCTQPCISCDHSQVQALWVPRGNDLSEGPQGSPTIGPSLRASEARVLWNSGWKSSASRLFSNSPKSFRGRLGASIYKFIP